MATLAAALTTPLRRGACCLGALVVALALHGGAAAQAASTPGTPAPASSALPLVHPPALTAELRDQTVVLSNRPIVTFRATLMGRSPRERALAGNTAVRVVIDRNGPGQVTVWKGADSDGLQVDGIIVFYLVAGDLDPGVTLPDAVQVARDRLQLAVDEAREATSPHHLAIGVVSSAAATLVAYVLIAGAFFVRRRAVSGLAAALDEQLAKHPTGSLASTYVHHARAIARGLAIALNWVVALVLLDIWATFVMRQFAFTRYWGERSTEWLIGVLHEFAAAIASAVPGLLMVVFIIFLARLATRANTALMQRIERGEVHATLLDRDTASPTRRIGNFVIWLFALAMAYPFLPGSNSDAFKGVSVMAGLMLSLGASSVVGQIMSGLSLMYSRSLRVGEYVKVGDVEGTVVLIGLFVTKVHTGLGEEVSVPNSVMISQPVQNFSRLSQSGFVVHSAVTIGYATPWRQVHAMLLEAARRTQGLAQDPSPHVLQTALSDWYVEYRLCAQCDALAAPRRVEVVNQLHGHIQDVFNENGVQIMSPHYVLDPREPQVVPPQNWSPGIVPPSTAAMDSSSRGR